MIIAITACYIVCVLIAFRVVKIKASPVSVASSAVIGVFLLTFVVIGWRISAPMTDQMTVKRDVIPLLSGQSSKELITKVHVPSDQMVKKGDVLYEVDSTPNQFTVDRLTAQIAASQALISELEAAVEVANAAVEAAKAGQDFAAAVLATEEGIQRDNPAAIAELKVTVQRSKFASSQAAVEQAHAQKQEAEFALASAREAVQATEAELETAKLNLEQCVILAPADGYIMNWQAIEGTMTTTVITSAQGVFVDMSETVIGAVFPQNMLKNVSQGDSVEMAFKSLPGQIAAGKVEEILEYTGEGQLQPSGILPEVAQLSSKGFLVVRILLDDEDLAKELPLGGAGNVAIYTQVGQPFHIISKIALRMKAWMYYAPI